MTLKSLWIGKRSRKIMDWVIAMCSISSFERKEKFISGEIQIKVGARTAKLCWTRGSRNQRSIRCTHATLRMENKDTIIFYLKKITGKFCNKKKCVHSSQEGISSI